jgi:CHAD domain-containing protein
VGDELELKYAVDDLAAVVTFLDQELPPAPGYGWRTLDVTDTYFDTEGRALAKAGYGARLRRHGTNRTVGLKSDIRTDGALVARTEIEAEATAALNPAAWPRSEARDIIRTIVRREPLLPRFALRQRKRRRDYGGLELSVDDVTIRHGRELVGELKELEVEYKSGRRSELTRVAKLIERSGLATPEPRSKMTLAAAMVEGAPSVYPGDALAESGRKVLARLLGRLEEREQAMRGGDTVALKQMRVTTRRMRAAWRTFGPAYRRGDVRRYVAELRAVARRLGAVRDLDVLLENLPSESELDGLRDQWRARRAQAWQELLDVLDSGEYRKFIDDYRNFVDTPGEAATNFGQSTRVADAAASLVWAGYESVRAAQPPLRGRAVPADLHQLRIAARQFRYTLEAYRDLLDPRATPALMERLVRLQDLVGELNDADVAAHEAYAWLADHPAAPPAVAAYWAELEKSVDRLSRAVAPAARGVMGITFRRLLGRAVAAI